MHNKGKILIVEDDNDINLLLQSILHKDLYEVKEAYSGTEGLLYLKNENFNLVILDLMLPGKSGEELLKELREFSDIPVIIISAKEEREIKPRTLRLGADDFISKPFDVDEVLARIEANLRRSKTSTKDLHNILEYEEIILNKESREVKVRGEEIILTSIEFNILELLIKNPQKVFSKTNLFNSVWGDNYVVDDNTITVHISNLRTKISKKKAVKNYIKTIWGIGYRLAP